MKSRHPQNINATTWYYENDHSIKVVHECRDENGRWLQTDTFNIPHHRLKKSLRRCSTQ